MRILYITTDISWPLSFGGEIRRWNILQGLKLAGDTDVLVFRKPGTAIAEAAFAGCRSVHEIPRAHIEPSADTLARYASTTGRGRIVLGSLQPFEYCGQDPKGLRRTVLGKVRPQDYDVVCFATGRTAWPLRDVFPAGRCLLDGDDFSYVRNWGLLRASAWYGAKLWDYLDVLKMWRIERSYGSRFGKVIRCSAEDKARHPADNVVVVPNGTFIPAAPARQPGPIALFVGDLGYEPNRRGAEWFLDQVWPAVFESVPDAKLRIAGRNPSPRILAADGNQGVSVLGFVADLGEHYSAAAVALVPLHAGGGTRLKILEALAYTVPVVSTRIGAFGIDAGPDKGLTLADEPGEFAKSVAAFLREPEGPAARAAVVGREYVRQHYDWSAIQQAVARLAADVARRSTPSQSRHGA